MRDRILESAERVIRHRGLAGSTTRQIAEAARCSEGTLYRYFSSKEDLFLAVLTERMPGFTPALRDLPGQAGKETVRQNLESVTVAGVAFFGASIPVAMSVFAEPRLLARHRAWMQKADSGPHRGAALLADYLREEQRLGRVRPTLDPQAAAALLLGACYVRALSGHFAQPDHASDAEFAERVVGTLIGAVAGVSP
jgi:AcrR family transcriptional regulator